jgi:glycosyltransferase involved in cell wall biosynthesis
MKIPHITVCICTCGRHALLERLLRDIARQETADAFTFSVVVIDNDAMHPARHVIDACARDTQLRIDYAIEPERNIALARNAALARAAGEFAVFIDDDEFPVTTWLLHLFRTCETHNVAGVLGPVLPHFDQPPARWIIKGGFYDRPRHPTGFVLPWHECRTGNVLFRRAILIAGEEPFRREFGSGGEDQDFFRRQIERGHHFIWCDEAIACEVVPPERWSARFLLSRALLRGKNTFRHPRGRGRNLAKSLLAVPLYLCALPFLLVLGFEHFMRYLIKLTDHVGRLLALLGINPVRVRRM